MIIISVFTSISVALTEFFMEEKMTIVFYAYGFIIPLLVLLPYIAFKTNGKIKKNVNIKWLRYIDRLSLAIIVINFPASLYFHKEGIQYDRFIHFGGAFFAFIIFLLLYLSVHVKIRGKEIKKNSIIVLSFLVLFISLFLWEGFQYTIDQSFGTKLLFDVTQDVKVDFWEDIFFGFSGIVASTFYVNRSFNKFLSVLK